MSTLKQVSVFLENKPGRLEEACQVLRDRGLNIRALSLADTSDFGILRLILTDPDAGLEALREAGFVAREAEVLRVRIPDRPGGLLDAVVAPLGEAGINIEYLYAFTEQDASDAFVVLRVEDVAGARRALFPSGVAR